MARLDESAQTFTAAQWAAADENERLRAQVSELLPWAHDAAALLSDGNPDNGANEMRARIESGKFGPVTP